MLVGLAGSGRLNKKLNKLIRTPHGKIPIIYYNKAHSRILEKPLQKKAEKTIAPVAPIKFTYFPYWPLHARKYLYGTVGSHTLSEVKF